MQPVMHRQVHNIVNRKYTVFTHIVQSDIAHYWKILRHFRELRALIMPNALTA